MGKKFIDNISIQFCDASYSAVHHHDFLELAYVTSGSAHHTINGKNMIIKKGDYFIIDYKTVHGYKSTGKERFEVINCLFMPEFIDNTLKNCEDFNQVINSYMLRFSYEINKNPADRIFHDDDGSIYDMLISMHDEFTHQQPGFAEIIRCNLIEIFIHTMRKAIKNSENWNYSSFSKYIISFINKNYMKKITLSDICKKTNYSLPYASRNFKQNTGMTFENYLQKVRIEQSCRLLANTDKKIFEISQLVGYSDSKFFNKVFKKNLNITPAEFRKLHK